MRTHHTLQRFVDGFERFLQGRRRPMTSLVLVTFSLATLGTLATNGIEKEQAPPIPSRMMPSINQLLEGQDEIRSEQRNMRVALEQQGLGEPTVGNYIFFGRHLPLAMILQLEDRLGRDWLIHIDRIEGQLREELANKAEEEFGNDWRHQLADGIGDVLEDSETHDVLLGLLCLVLEDHLREGPEDELTKSTRLIFPRFDENQVRATLEIIEQPLDLYQRSSADEQRMFDIVAEVAFDELWGVD